jgi:hypothetical protein
MFRPSSSALTVTLAALTIAATADDSVWKKHTIAEAKLGMINSAVAHDWDKDGHIDVLTSFDNRVVLLRGPDWTEHIIDKIEQSRSRNKVRNGCMHSCLMDVDGDGDLDFAGSNSTVFWLECPDDPFTDGLWKYRVVDDEILGTHCLITGDVNQDGKVDLIANSGRSKGTEFTQALTWLEVPTDPHDAKNWFRHVFAPPGEAPDNSHYAGFGDANGDGRPDIAYGAKGNGDPLSGGWFAWWEQPEDAKAPWRKHLLSAPEIGASNIMPADLNGDDHLDWFATRGHAYGVLWFRGPDFEMIKIDPDFKNPHSLDLADIDGDGDIDAITCSKDPDGHAAWFENSGSGTFTRHDIATNQGSYDTRLCDMDKDGDLDVLIAGHTSRNVVWFENPIQ